jgi:MFS family permease
LFEIPAGYLGDRIGPRRVLLRIVLWWSFFTAATGWMRNLWSLIVTRFLFGAGEAGCFPNLTKAFNRWLPATRTARAQGIMWMSARLGGAFTPLLVFGCLQLVSWRTAFLLFGLLGVVWAAIFFWWYRDDPRTHQKRECRRSGVVAGGGRGGRTFQNPVGTLFTSRTVWCLCGQYFACSYCFYFFITWFPTYLLKQHGFDMKQSALLAGTPLMVGARVAVRRLVVAQIWPLAGRCRARASFHRRGGLRGRGRIDRGGAIHAAVSRRDGHRAGGVLQRRADARRVDGVHGRGRQSRRHALRHDEHDGQHRRLPVVHRVRLPRATHRELESGLLRDGGDVCRRLFCWLAMDPVTPLEQQTRRRSS